MSAADLVDAALIGFDRKESVTIPPLRNEAGWASLESARQTLLQDLAEDTPAERYRAPA
jgi:short-subunit dehydrogenase